MIFFLAPGFSVSTRNKCFCLYYVVFVVKVHIFWEGHKIWRNLPLTFDCMYCSQKLVEDFAKFLWLSQNIWTLTTAIIQFWPYVQEFQLRGHSITTCTRWGEGQKNSNILPPYSTWFWDSIWKKPAVVGAQKMSSGSWVEEHSICNAQAKILYQLHFFSFLLLSFYYIQGWANM